MHISAGAMHACALLYPGTVRCWGDNAYGQLGDGTTTTKLTLDLYDVLSDVRTVAVGDGSSCSIMNTGYAMCWGSNWAGQLGTGVFSNAIYPTNVLVISAVSSLSMGPRHACAVWDGASGKVTVGDLVSRENWVWAT
jgi:alpha-tubulin suppressor-like RCC1 family protein